MALPGRAGLARPGGKQIRQPNAFRPGLKRLGVVSSIFLPSQDPLGRGLPLPYPSPEPPTSRLVARN